MRKSTKLKIFRRKKRSVILSVLKRHSLRQHTPVQFWSRELRCDHRHSDGERIHWNDVYPADFRYPWKFHRIFHPAAISAGVRGADDYDG